MTVTCKYAAGQVDGRAEVCSALCGERWVWEGRCVCLAPLPRPVTP